MNQVSVREAYGEVLIFLDKHTGSRLNALKEAVGILQKEVDREQSSLNNIDARALNSDQLSQHSETNGQ